MKPRITSYIVIDDYKTVDELLDAAEADFGPGVFIKIGRYDGQKIALYANDYDERAVRFAGSYDDDDLAIDKRDQVEA